MKHNLKNRPWMTPAKANTYAVKSAQDELMVFERWFEGFEKELREIIQALADFHNEYDEGKKAILKDILGEVRE